MARSRLAFAMMAAAVLAGCTTTKQANDAMASRYVGHSADSFFIERGPPQSSYALSDGRKIFLWAEGAKSIYMPGSSTSTVTGSGSMAIVNTTYNPGGTINIQCAVKLLVGKDDKIQQITAQSDSIGLWQMSRCNEIFGK